VGVDYLAGLKSFYDEVKVGDLPWDLMEEAARRMDGHVYVYIFGAEGIKDLNVLVEVPDNQVHELILLPT